MQQRASRRSWGASDRAARAVHPATRPRLLVESAEPAAAISDYAAFADSGFEVAVCSGPGADSAACPLLAGKDCELVDGADVVMNCLDPDPGVADAIVARHPDLAVVVESRRGPDGTLAPVPEGCIPLVFPSSVNGQVNVVRRAAVKRSQRSPDL